MAGSYTFEVERQAFWDRLLDPANLQRCIPRCREFTQPRADRYAATIGVGIGVIKGTYRGTMTITDVDEPSSLTMVVEGKGTGGGVEGRGTVTVTEHDGKCLVSIDGDAKVSGFISLVGERVLSAAARVIMDEFFACMRGKIESG